MAVPSCVSFRDQEVLMDKRKLPYSNWTRLETYCHNLAAKHAMREYMDKFEKVLIDGLKIAKELFRRGALFKNSVDNCDPAQFADIPDFYHHKNSFFSSMFRSIDNSFRYWYVLLDVLRMYPECRDMTDQMEQFYEQTLVEFELPKYQGQQQIATPEEAKVLFDRIYAEFQQLWDDASEILLNLDIEKLRNNLRLCYMDDTEKVEEITDKQVIVGMLRSRIDIMNLSSLDTVMMDSEMSEMQTRIRTFCRNRALTCARIRIKDFAHQLETNPLHKPVHFEEDASMQLCVDWDKDEVMFRYFWLIEIVFSTLTRHQYFHHIDMENFSFWFYLPDWMRHAMMKLTRERQYCLKLDGVRMATVLYEMTITDPKWGLTRNDYFDFMTSVIRINNGAVIDVQEELDGKKPFRRWEMNDIDKRQDSIIDFVEEWPESVPVPPQVATISGFMTLFENNHLWLSHPFFTRKRGFKMCLCVYPRGTGTGLGTHLSVGVCLMRGENDDHLAFPIRGALTLRLLNQTGDHSHVQQVFEYTDDTRPEVCDQVKNCMDFAPVALSIHEFVPLSLLEYNETQGTQYLVNDCLYIQIMEADFVHRK